MILLRIITLLTLSLPALAQFPVGKIKSPNSSGTVNLNRGADGYWYEKSKLGPALKIKIDSAQIPQLQDGLNARRPETSLTPSSFGALGTGAADDTQALKSTMSGSKPSAYIPYGTYLSGPITLPESGWNAGEQNTQNMYYLDGGAGGFHGATLQAKPGVNTLLTINNTAGVVIKNLTLKGAFDTKNIADFSWKGTLAGGAPANLNKLENIYIQGGTGAGSIALNLDQFHDSKISGISINTSAEYALSFQGGGGYLGASDMQLYGGKTRMAAQNGTIHKTVFTRGLELTGGSFNLINLDVVHFISIDADAINSIGSGNATRSLEINSGFFNAPADPAGAAFAGRYWSGATIKNSWFESGKLTRNIVAAAGDGSPMYWPRFRFENCQFGNVIQAPTGCVYEFINCINSNGQLFSGTMNGSWQFQGGVQTDKLLVQSGGNAVFQLQGGTPYMDFLAPDGSVKSRIINVGSSLYFDGSQPIDFNGAWNAPNQLRISGNVIWVDAAGKLRMKLGKPDFDTDGTVIGSQN